MKMCYDWPNSGRQFSQYDLGHAFQARRHEFYIKKPGEIRQLYSTEY